MTLPESERRPDHLTSNRELRATYSHSPKLASRNVQIGNPLTNVFASLDSCIGRGRLEDTKLERLSDGIATEIQDIRGSKCGSNFPNMKKPNL